MNNERNPGCLLDIDSTGKEEVLSILDAAEAFFEVSRRPVRKVPALRGKTIINLFYEASTRTRTSFELAGKRLGADVINMSTASSSVKKGESLLDTAQTLQAMQPDVIVLRHGASGAGEFVADRVRAAVVNAGDGQHAHPTQALLDAFTMRRRLSRLEGLTVTICGDVARSRVARSNARLLNLFGCTVRFVGPQTMIPVEAESLGVEVHHELRTALEGADVVMVLRIQHERGKDPVLPSAREYSRTFGISPRTLASAPENVLVMHPGPMNRGVEIDYELADSAQSAVLDQVEAGVAIRMAVLYRAAGAGALPELGAE